MAKKKENEQSPKLELELNVKYQFTNKDNDFIASIRSFEPLAVTEYLVRNGCQVEMELSIDSLDEYKISPISKADLALRLTQSDV